MRAILLGSLLVAGACAPKAAPDLSVVPTPGPPRIAAAPNPVVTKLQNGVPVYTIEAPSLPLVSVRLVMPTGTVDDPAARGGLASVGTTMLGEAAGPRSSLEQAAALDALAASLGFSSGREATTMALDVHRDALSGALPLAADALLRPGFRDDDLARVREQHVAGLQSSYDNNGTIASLVAARTWWGEAHPYGRPGDGTPASVEAITMDDLRAWHQGQIHAGGAAFVVIGAITPAEATSALDAHFGAMEARPRPARTVGAPAAAGGIVLVDRPGSTQTIVSVTLPGSGTDGPMRAEIEALRTILGGSFTSRLNRRLREELGYTYGARMSVTRLRGGGVIGAGAAVRADATGAAVSELLTLLRAARDSGVDAAEAARGRAQMITGEVDGSETRSGLAGVVLRELVDGREPASRAAYLAQVDALTAEAVTAAAAKLDVDGALIVLVGDAAVVRPQLEAAGLGPAREVTAP